MTGSVLVAAVVRVARCLTWLALVGCTPSPVQWDAQRTGSGAQDRVALSPQGALVPDSMAMLAARITPPSGTVCPGSLVLARAGARLFAAWWSVRADSSARLLSATTADEGGSWSANVPVDTTDQGVTGCRRTPPALAADAASGYVHLSYAMDAKEGPGLFFAHSMDAGATFHEPVPIFYGEGLGRSSVAADGDVVVVAFEDPTSAIPRVGLALSQTMGHIFEQRLLPVSDDNGVASNPLAAVQGRRIAVAWQRHPATDSTPAVLAIKSGLLR